jgi:hypothetical protein
MIVDADRDDHGVPVLDAANAAVPVATSILVTLSQPEVAGHVIDKCDSILLKPFASSLLSSRVGRLLRLQQHSRELRQRSNRMLERLHVDRAKSNHLKQRFSAGTLREWPNHQCPYCAHGGVVFFDYAGMRRAWYACPGCRQVWLAKRLE